MNAAEFTCDSCGETFPKGWSDEEARAEADELFGDDLGDDPAVVCDDCFNAMTAKIPIADWRAEQESPSEWMQRLRDQVDAYRATLSPLRLYIYDELVRMGTDLLLYGEVRETSA